MRERNSKPQENWSERTKRVLSSFDEMKKAMRQVFGDLDERMVAAQKLQKLCQNRSVREYITEFQTIASNLEWDGDALMDKFKGGLKQNILNLLIYFPDEPKDLEELFERAQKIDRETVNQKSRENYSGRNLIRTDRTFRSFERRYNDKTPFAKENRGYPPSRDRDGDVQMTGAKVDLEKARRERLCFNCGKQGHRARSCKAKKRNQDPKIRMVRTENEPEFFDNDTESYSSSMMRELTKEKVRNDHRRRTIHISDNGNQEQPDVSATEFQEIDIEEG